MSNKLTFSTKNKNIQVKYNTNDGAGQGHILCDIFSHVIEQFYPNTIFENCLDWCSGPGFIGFTLFDENKIKKLSLFDSYGPFIISAKAAAKQAGISEYVKTYVSDHIAALPNKNHYDLIVGNPPWASTTNIKDVSFLRIFKDENWTTHREFFANVRKYMAPNCTILLSEGKDFSNPDTFKPFLEENGLYIHRIHDHQDFTKVYLLEIKSK